MGGVPRLAATRRTPVHLRTLAAPGRRRAGTPPLRARVEGDREMEQEIAVSPGVTVPDLVEPVIGFRQWRLRDGELWSAFADWRWTRGTNTARCIAADTTHAADAPASACTCGLYAWYRPCPLLASAATSELVAGAVAMWGAMELHATGMRAEHAVVVALARPLARAAKRRRVDQAARAYAVPAVSARGLPLAALAAGRPLGRGFLVRLGLRTATPW